MGLKWTDRQDGVDYVMSEDVNKLARAIIELEERDNTPSIDIDETLTQSGKAADAKVTGDRLSTVEQQIADMNYTPIAFDSVSTSPKQAEMGATITNATVYWETNKTPTEQTFNGKKIYADANAMDIKEAVTMNSNNSWTIVAIDERGARASRTATLPFYNGVYYGAKAEPAEYNSAFILGLTRDLRSNKRPSFTANAGAGQYIYYCLPKRMGKCVFTVGVLPGGFIENPIEVSFTNASGYTETYYVYRSNNAGLGEKTVNVS